MPKLVRIAPELPVTELPAGLEYYQNQLGFHVVSEFPGHDYAIVERDDVAIHLFEDGRPHSSVSIHLFTIGLDELHAELTKRGALVRQDILRQPWGNRDFRVNDPWGNELKFTEPLEENEPRRALRAP